MALKCVPVTLSGMAWCYLNSFEALWGLHRREFANCPLQTPTLGMFLCYYSFITDRSWVTVRQTKNKLFSWSKVDRTPNRFLYLGIRPAEDEDWTSYVCWEWQTGVYLRGRVPLSTRELCAVEIIERIRESKPFLPFLCLSYCMLFFVL